MKCLVFYSQLKHDKYIALLKLQALTLPSDFFYFSKLRESANNNFELENGGKFSKGVENTEKKEKSTEKCFGKRKKCL